MFAASDNNQNDNATAQHCNDPSTTDNINMNSYPMDTSQCSDINDYTRDYINLTNIKVTVGIDEDLQMILEMDPSIVDLGVDVIGCTPAKISPNLTPTSYGLPPILGG